MSNQMRLQQVARSPLLQQLMARRAQQGPTDFRGQHPLAAAMHGISQGLQMRALRKAEGEKQKQQDSASEALQRAMSGGEDITLSLPQSDSEFSYGGDQATFAGQGPGTPNEILAAALNPALSRQQAGIGLQTAQSRATPAATPLIQRDPTKDLVNPVTGEIVSKGQATKAPIKLGKNDRLVDSDGKEIVGPVPDTAIERMNLGKGVIIEFDPETGKNNVMRIELPKDVELTGHMATPDEKDAMGLAANESYWIGSDGKPTKVAGTTEIKAARIAQLEIGRDAWSKAREMLFDKNGGLNSAAVTAARTNTPLAGGRTIRGLAITALDAYLRATSGAAVPETEVERAFEAFFPSFAQPAADAKRRMDILDQFLSGSQDLLLPGSTGKKERKWEDLSEAEKRTMTGHVDSMVEASGSSDELADDENQELQELRRRQGGANAE